MMELKIKRKLALIAEDHVLNALHLAKKHVKIRTRNAAHARKMNVIRKKCRNNAPLPATNANLVDLVEMRLARIKPEQKNARRTRTNVKRTRRCKRSVPKRARNASNKRHPYDSRSCRCPNYKIIDDDKFSYLSYLPINMFILS